VGRVEAVAAVGVDVGVSDGVELRERVVADQAGLGRADLVDRGGEVARVPREDRVGDEFEAQRVAAVVVFVGGKRPVRNVGTESGGKRRSVRRWSSWRGRR
jgi:hypothetical protein